MPVAYFMKHFSQTAKSITRLSCSLINALWALSSRYQLFAVIGACSLCSHKGEQTKSFRPPFSKGGRASGQSPEPLSADSGTLLTKRFLKGIRETFSRKKFPFNFARNAFSSPQIFRWHICGSSILIPQKVVNDSSALRVRLQTSS